MSSAKQLSKELHNLGDAKIAEHSQRFFKTGVGEYGEGDKFLGIRVPVLRNFAKKHKDASLRTALSLLKSKWHEERLTALLMLVNLYKKDDAKLQEEIFKKNSDDGDVPLH